MLRFFRTIRQRLLNSNKFSKYVLYAVGEILLVVIGILIALQIDNWNEQRLDRVKEQAALRQLKEDFQSNLIQLEDKISARESILSSAVRLLNAFDKPIGIKRESVIEDLAIVRNDPTFDPIQNDLINSENLKLIQNQKLRHLLSNWTSDVVGVLEIEKSWTKLVYEQYIPITSELGLTRDINNSFINNSEHNWLLDKNPNSFKIEIGTSNRGSTVNEILTNRQLESLISESIAQNKGANLQSEALHQRIIEILDLIEDGLNR